MKYRVQISTLGLNYPCEPVQRSMELKSFNKLSSGAAALVTSTSYFELGSKSCKLAMTIYLNRGICEITCT